MSLSAKWLSLVSKHIKNASLVSGGDFHATKGFSACRLQFSDNSRSTGNVEYDESLR
jgi:hypothetical protein